MNNRLIVRTFLAALGTLVLTGCSSGTSSAPQQNPITGQHPAAWLQNHWSAYLQNPASCVTCHGSTTVASATPNPVAPSCFSCHGTANGPAGPHHPANWNTDPNVPAHGLAAMAASGAAFDPANPSFTMQGFTSCTPCHAQTNATTGLPDFTNPLGMTPSCLASGCHSSAAPFAPHSLAANTKNAFLWGASTGTGTTMPNHDQVDPSNAAVCAQCHTAGSTNNPINPKVLAPAGTAPGCGNGTLCHSSSF